MSHSTYLCFGARPGQGNAALVVDGEGSRPGARQALAATSGTGATVFLDEGGTVLDFYYPHARSVLCLHATLAAAAHLFARQGHDAPIAVRTSQNGQRLQLTRDDKRYMVGLAAQPVPEIAVDDATVRALLRAPFVAASVASVGSPKLLVEVADRGGLQALAPDLAGILEWSRIHRVNGFYVYCRLGAAHYAGRNFNHLMPAQEDKATGVAAGALSVHLGRGITLEQSDGCRIVTATDGKTVRIGGRAELVSTPASV